MFIRERLVNGASYFSVVESYRDGGRVRQRTVVSLGQSATIKEAIADCANLEQAYAHSWTDTGMRRFKKLQAKLALLKKCLLVMSKRRVGATPKNCHYEQTGDQL